MYEKFSEKVIAKVRKINHSFRDVPEEYRDVATACDYLEKVICHLEVGCPTSIWDDIMELAEFENLSPRKVVALVVEKTKELYCARS